MKLRLQTHPHMCM